VPASADQPLDVGLHQQLQDALSHSTQKVTVAGLLQKLIQWQSARFSTADSAENYTTSVDATDDGS
jgi:hypothetical protein